MISIRQYLFSIGNSHGLTRTLGEIDVYRSADGKPVFSAGNSAVVFKIRHKGIVRALRCYTRPTRNLAALYQDRLLPEELFIHRTPTHGEWVDVVLCDWIEGETLHERIQKADAKEFRRLAEAFDLLAAEMVADKDAHGDLKPENIIVQPDGALSVIDLDASYIPQFAGMESPELGTAAFQHPARTKADFDARLDDFPAALISTALHALALDPSLRNRHGTQDTLLIDPQRLPQNKALDEILTLFERHGMAAHYRIARLLLAPTPRLNGLARLFRCATSVGMPTPPQTELFEENGLWGYRCAATAQTAIPALYDCGFDFTEGLAAVQLGSTWHYIDISGHTVVCCPECKAVKPFRNGRARVLRESGWSEIDRAGKAVVLEY